MRTRHFPHLRASAALVVVASFGLISWTRSSWAEQLLSFEVGFSDPEPYRILEDDYSRFAGKDRLSADSIYRIKLAKALPGDQRMGCVYGPAFEEVSGFAFEEAPEPIADSILHQCVDVVHLDKQSKEVLQVMAGFKTRGILEFLFLPPFPVEPPKKAHENHKDNIPLVAWVPVSEVNGGVEVSERWRSSAYRDTPLTCEGPDCLRIFSVFYAGMPNDTSMLASCWVKTFSKIEGLPVRCQPLLVDTEEMTFVRAVVALLGIVKGETSGMPDSDLYIIPGDLPIEAQDLVVAFEKELLGEKWRLKTERYGLNVYATSGIRNSLVLPGWREQLTISVAAAAYDPTCTMGLRTRDNRSHCLGLIGTTTLYVNKQNTHQSSDWHLPSPAQGAEYADKLTDRMRDLLESFCAKHDRSPTWTNPRTLKCKEGLKRLTQNKTNARGRFRSINDLQCLSVRILPSMSGVRSLRGAGHSQPVLRPETMR